ncbi:30S ribosomal protein S20 [Candidatus Nomurabacteria bacterium]|nr:30S ribosomal protein S20 [Candidatus Nomurabacteria bacterium]
MPITQSAKKAIRGSLRKKGYNDRSRRAMKEVIKKIEKIAKSDNQTGKEEARRMLSSAFAIIDKAAKTNVIKKNNAARKKSRLSRLTK